MKVKEEKRTFYQLTAAALMAAVMCILGPMVIPIGAVPISLTNLAIYFAVYLLGTKYGTISYLVYLLLGTAGLPVFSSYSGGLMKVAGPTGGYLIGFLPMAVISGLLIEAGRGKKLPAVIGMILGTLVAYLLGTVWFVVQTQCQVWYALTICVFPFLIGDGLKIALAATVGPVLHRRLAQAGLLEKNSVGARNI
ncbi:MAG: biotin transporter BioY [Intestinimonas sp.]|nr:biotin transporter BioY [Intestinimonas sp.]